MKNFRTLSNNPCPNTPTVTDIENNVYNTVQIGNQCWMAENMKTAKYADGQEISSDKMFNPNDSVDNVATYGLLYTWSAATRDSSTTYPAAGQVKVQGICPAGWHVPSDAEWDTLTRYVFSKDEYKCGDDCGEWQARRNVSCIAKALSSTTGWNSSDEPCTPGNNPSANNATGFSAVPAGRFSDGDFNDFGDRTDFWSATHYDAYDAWCRRLYSDVSTVYRNANDRKDHGYSVRCLKDAEVPAAMSVTTDSANTVTNNTATLHGNVTNMGEYSEVYAGFKYGTSVSGIRG